MDYRILLSFAKCPKILDGVEDSSTKFGHNTGLISRQMVRWKEKLIRAMHQTQGRPKEIHKKTNAEMNNINILANMRGINMDGLNSNCVGCQIYLQNCPPLY